MPTRWHPFTHPEPVPRELALGMAPTLRHPCCRKPCCRREARDHEESSAPPAEVQEASQSRASKARPQEKGELPQATRQKQAGAQDRLPQSLR